MEGTPITTDDLVEDTQDKMTPQEQSRAIIEIVEAGGATFDSICEAAQLPDKKAFNQIMKFMQILDKFPHVNDEGIYSFVTQEEKMKLEEEKKEAKKKKAKPPIKLQPLRKSTKRAYATKVASFNKAVQRAAAKPEDIILQLTREKIRIEMAIAKKKLENAYDTIVKELKLPNVDAINSIENLDEYRVEHGL